MADYVTGMKAHNELSMQRRKSYEKHLHEALTDIANLEENVDVSITRKDSASCLIRYKYNDRYRIAVVTHEGVNLVWDGYAKDFN